MDNKLFDDTVATLIIVISASCIVESACYLWAFRKYGHLLATKLMMFGAIGTAVSWLVFSFGAQQFLQEPSELRQMFIISGLITKLIFEIAGRIAGILLFGIEFRKL